MNSANGCNMKFKLRTNMAIVALIAMFLFAIFGIAGARAIAESTSGSTISKDDIIVVYKDGTSTTAIKKQLDANDSSTDNIAKVDSDTKYAVADVPDGQTVNETIKQYEKSSAVEYAQPNHIYKALSYSGNDTDYSNLWSFAKIGVVAASIDYDSISKKTTTENSINVAVLDTGLYVFHEDLKKYVNTSLSVDIVNNDKLLTDSSENGGDSDGHGTHVAGIIGATAGNNIGVAGVGSAITDNKIDIIAEDVFNGKYADDGDIIKGIYYAVQNGAKVINMSLGGTSDYSYDDTFNAEPALKAALDYCESSGVTVVCAAGNDGDNSDAEKVNVPGDYADCISVTATDYSNSVAYYSSHNRYKDIASPGGTSNIKDDPENIYSTLPYNQYGYEAGTSMAAPVVTGIVASMYSVDSALTPAQVRQILYDTATDLGTSGWDQYYGHGLVNADKAIKTAYALKTGESVTARFDVNGGSYVSTGSENLKAGSTLSTLPTAKRKGYVLAGWYDGTSAGDKITSSTMITADKTYYAHWTKVTVSKTALSSVKSKSRKIYAVSKKASGAKGYQLRRSTYKSFKKSKYTTKTSNKITTGKLTKNKYYYIKVRAYKLDSTNSKIYGSWSSAKKIKVKS